MLGGVEFEFETAVIPASESPGCFADVVLAVVADAHGEHFHDLAREVFIRRAFDVHAGVEIGEHGRVLRRADQKGAEIAEAVAVEQLQLALHLAIVAYLLFTAGEMAVPEHRHLFLERCRRRHHAIGPPVGQAISFKAAGAQPVEEFVDHRLQRAIAAGLDLHAEGLTLGLGELGGGGTAGRKRVEAGFEDARFVKRQLRLDGLRINAFEVHQVTHRLLGRHACQLVDFTGRAAEAGAFK